MMPALFLVLALLARSALATVPASAPSYAQIAGGNGQWRITLSKRLGGAVDFVPHVCNTTAFGAPCNQPVLEERDGSAVKISFTLRNTSAPFRTWKDAKPVEILVRLDYMPISAVDRGWRKKNGGWPGHGKHVKWNVATLPFTTNGGEAIWELDDADEVTDAVLYPEICVMCENADGSVDYCQCDRTNAPANANTVETQVPDDKGVTPGVTAAAIIFSVFCPVLMIVYYIADWFHYKRTGNVLNTYKP